MHYAKTLLKTFSLSFLLSSCSTSASEDVRLTLGVAAAFGVLVYRWNSCSGRLTRLMAMDNLKDWWSGNRIICEENYMNVNEAAAGRIEVLQARWWKSILDQSTLVASNAEHVQRNFDEYCEEKQRFLTTVRGALVYHIAPSVHTTTRFVRIKLIPTNLPSSPDTLWFDQIMEGYETALSTRRSQSRYYPVVTDPSCTTMHGTLAYDSGPANLDKPISTDRLWFVWNNRRV